MDTDSSPKTALENKFVLVRLEGQLFGIPAHLISEMIQLPTLTSLPKSPAGMRGVFVLRGSSVAAYDLRALLGIQTLAAELDGFRSMLQAREQDHLNWIAELEASVREARPFKLATDPHKCAFGRWFDTFETTSVLIRTHLRKFDTPHRRIHAVAVEVGQLIENGEVLRALARIEETRGTELKQMIHLFKEFDELLRSSSREVAVVLGDHGIAYCVDVVEGMRDVRGGASDSDPQVRSHPRMQERGLTPTIVGPDRELALLIDEDHLPGLVRSL